MDKRACRQCRKNRKMTEDFDHGWCNSCIIDLQLKNIQLEAENSVFAEQNLAMNDTTVKQSHRIEQLEEVAFSLWCNDPSFKLYDEVPNRKDFGEALQKALENK